MRASEFYVATLKETPADAELVSHRLMLRSGMIRRCASGLYSWLPLGLRVLRQVENIVAEEMDNVGALEMLMPMVQSAELWQESGRWDQYGKELLRLVDRHERNFCLGPTHEEVVTDLIRRDISSYKQLPMIVYQVQTKFRDEIRPRFGVMRSREFIMKDAYSFHMTTESLEKAYDAMRDAYNNIFSRLGLTFRPVLADSGSIGGDRSQEFHVLADSGEDAIAYCEQSDYAANVEKAEAQAPQGERQAPGEAMNKVATPDAETCQAVADCLSAPLYKVTKTLIVKGESTPMVALILRGDHALNDIKAQNHPMVSSPLTLLDKPAIAEALGAACGSLGPVGLSIPMIIDRDCAMLDDFLCGANDTGFHYQHVNWERDVPLGEIADLREVVDGDMSPDGKGPLKIVRGIEVGHIFQLGDKYTRPMKATVLDENGKAVTLHSGCYGIGISRIVAAAIEQHNDARGIVWPEAMAPFDIALLPMHMHKSYRVREAAEQLYGELCTAGYDVYFDDRKERPGVMFSEADLMGIPHRLVISESGLDEGSVEYKARASDTKESLPLADILGTISERV